MVANVVYPFHIHIQFHNSSNYFFCLFPFIYLRINTLGTFSFIIQVTFFFVYFPLFICLQLWRDFHLHQVIPKVFMVANVVYPFQTR